MILEDLIIKAKSGQTETSNTKALVINIIRSDLFRQKGYIDGMLTDTVRHLDFLNITRSAESIVLCELGIRSFKEQPLSGFQSGILRAFIDNKYPVLFVCEDSPITNICTNEFITELTNRGLVKDHGLLCINQREEESPLTVFNDGKETQFRINLYDRVVRELS